MDEGRGQWRIKEFSARVGVPESTLRAWEQRYRLLRPERTSGGFRLYSAADERRLRSMLSHMHRGVAPAQAAALALEDASHNIVNSGDVVIELLAATARYDARRFDSLLDRAFTLGRVPAIREVVLPMLVEVGRRWAENELSIGHEHFATHLIERRLLLLAADWQRGDGPLVLLACPPRERHTLGLIAFGLVLAEFGWRVSYLGADTPIAQVSEAAGLLNPDAIVLCVLNPRISSGLAAEIEALGREHRTLLAGSGADGALAARLGVEYAAADPATAALELAAGAPG